MNEDRITGQRAGIRWAIAWLRKRADTADTSADYIRLLKLSQELADAAKALRNQEIPSESWQDILDTAARDMSKAARALRKQEADDITAGLEALSEPIVAEWGEVKDRLNLGKED